MEIQDIRRQRLWQLIETRYGASQARFVDETGENQGEISALLKTKSFGEKKARKIEVKAKLPAGWLDGLNEEGPPGASQAEAQIDDQSLPKDQVFLVYVDTEELALITAFRQSSALGKSTIKTAAEISDKALLTHGVVNQL